MGELKRSRLNDPALVQTVQDLVRQSGADPQALSGRLIREMIQTSLQLARDGADTGELKLVSRSLKELRYAMKVFRQYRKTRKVSIFGSARTPEGDPSYIAACEFARLMSQSGWMVITGAGDGIMAAGHGGAGPEASFGVAIRLPFETTANKFIKGDSKLVTFRYFFSRKLMFVSQSDAVTLFPGGFGTHDEGFEVLTLVQTGKTGIVPIVMLDSPGGSYWHHWDQYVRGHLLASGMIDANDLNLYYLTDSPQQAVDHILRFYRNYHSQRFVNDHLAIRILHPLSQTQLDALRGEFSDLVAEGCIEQTGPLEGEEQHLDLPRLSFVFTRRDYGRLRLLIDRVNEAVS